LVRTTFGVAMLILVNDFCIGLRWPKYSSVSCLSSGCMPIQQENGLTAKMSRSVCRKEVGSSRLPCEHHLNWRQRWTVCGSPVAHEFGDFVTLRNRPLPPTLSPFPVHAPIIDWSISRTHALSRPIPPPRQNNSTIPPPLSTNTSSSDRPYLPLLGSTRRSEQSDSISPCQGSFS